jgi:hypothetical protein
MGIDYFLIDKKNKTFFELGRGNWYNLGYDLGCINDPGKLQECLLDEVFSYYGDLRGEMHFLVSEYLVNELHSCFGSIPTHELFVISDCSDSYRHIRQEGYQCIGTRYEVRGTQEWHDTIGYYDQKPESA